MRTISLDDIFAIKDLNSFEQIALDIFNYQAENNTVYKEYLYHLGINVSNIIKVEDIPFLPIEFFKTHQVLVNSKEIAKKFFSSGTTGQQSTHLVHDLKLYEQSIIKSFKKQFGKLDQTCILALLPTYLENESSSLVYMVDYLIQLSKHPDSGFYLDNIEELAEKLQKLQNQDTSCLLIGVSYALIDLAEKFPMDLSNIMIMETGGMKGKRKELTKKELHQFLASKFNVSAIYSEYGMTELLSQAYSSGNGLFFTPPWMKIMIRDTYDPFSYLEKGKTGGVNIIDLANVYSCSFIETKDLGKTNSDGSFEILGRFDQSDIRGCNLMIAE